MASSLAFWLEKKESIVNELKVNTEVHINYWSLAKDNINFLDIGVKLTANQGLKLVDGVKSINVYLPFERENIEYVADLGQLVCTDQELLSAIFNSYIEEYSHVNDSGIYNITLPGNETLSFFTQIESEDCDGLTGVKISELDDRKEKGTLISFPCDLFDPCGHEVKESIYFRFRIKLNNNAVKRISTITRPGMAVLLGDLNNIETVDFRINEARNLPFKIRAKVNKNKSLHVVHYFLIRDAVSEFKASHTSYDRSRLLETEIWDKYLGLKKNTSQYLIYHWKKKTNGFRECNDEGIFIDHFSAFAKFTSNNIPRRLIISVIAISLIVGVISGIGANFIWKEIDIKEHGFSYINHLNTCLGKGYEHIDDTGSEG